MDMEWWPWLVGGERSSHVQFPSGAILLPEHRESFPSMSHGDGEAGMVGWRIAGRLHRGKVEFASERAILQAVLGYCSLELLGYFCSSNPALP